MMAKYVFGFKFQSINEDASSVGDGPNLTLAAYTQFSWCVFFFFQFLHIGLCWKMAKGSKVHRRIASRRIKSCPYSLSSSNHCASEKLLPKKYSSSMDQCDFEDVICSVCMECPHNAVLLLCSSHDKGCRPFMCGTSFRYSNCLDQYKKAYAKAVPNNEAQHVENSTEAPNAETDLGWSLEKFKDTKLTCPLCRGQVKGWTVVEPAREYLNLKKRNCMQENCSFIGTYKELRKHMKAKHPQAQPREVDPALEQKWRSLERERDRDDVISTIRSSMPGAMVFGDYVIERNNYEFDTDDDLVGDVGSDRGDSLGSGLGSNFVNVFLLLHAFGPSGNDMDGRMRPSRRMLNSGSNIISVSSETDSNNSYGGGDSIAAFRRIHRDFESHLGHSRRRRRHREER